MECKFVVGQKVVCVKSQMHYITEGNVYTVAKVAMGWDQRTGDSGPYVRLAEPETSFCDNGGWAAYLFRPLIKRKTDIAIFQRILDDCRKEIVA